MNRGIHTKPIRGASHDWLTPPEIVRALGRFSLDPCAHPQQFYRTARRMIAPPPRWPLCVLAWARLAQSAVRRQCNALDQASGVTRQWNCPPGRSYRCRAMVLALRLAGGRRCAVFARPDQVLSARWNNEGERRPRLGPRRLWPSKRRRAGFQRNSRCLFSAQ